jgi:hypothetical protein
VRARLEHGTRKRRRGLARYVDERGRLREVVALPGMGGSVLVVDRDAATLGERLLVAHLAADEPAENAAIVCSRYMADTRGDDRQRCRCRRVTAEDLERMPFTDVQDDRAELEIGRLGTSAAGEARSPIDRWPEEHWPVDRHGGRYRLEPLQTGMSIPELRWRRHPPPRADGEPESTPQPQPESQPVSLRDAIAGLERYEPVRGLTVRALALYGEDAGVSTVVLSKELERVQSSPIVLNRELRQAVLEAVEWEGLSMSEIAIRCGRVKRDCRGKVSGETSWLERRIGIRSESGAEHPTPWVHSDVLALIARRGLGIGPHEVGG